MAARKKAASAKRSAAMKQAWETRRQTAKSDEPRQNGARRGFNNQRLSFAEEMKAYSNIVEVLDNLPGRSRKAVMEFIRETPAL